MDNIDRGPVDWGMGIGLQGDQWDQLNVGGEGISTLKWKKFIGPLSELKIPTLVKEGFTFLCVC